MNFVVTLVQCPVSQRDLRITLWKRKMPCKRAAYFSAKLFNLEIITIPLRAGLGYTFISLNKFVVFVVLK